MIGLPDRQGCDGKQRDGNGHTGGETEMGNLGFHAGVQTGIREDRGNILLIAVHLNRFSAR